jgi:HEAT repeat protein
MLVEDHDGARLYLFSKGNVSLITTHRPEDGPGRQLDEALEMTRSADPRTRVRGLTLLSDVEDPIALDTALVLLSDPAAAVREEAVQLIIEHRGSDIASIVEIASHDPSSRVRQAAAELIAERSDDWGD